jgi:hypothetical protein
MTTMRVRSISRALLKMALLAGFCSVLPGCGGSHAFAPPPVVLSVTVNESPIVISPGQTIYVPVLIMAPTETASFAIAGLPAGVSASYKESESNPSGQLTLIASSGAQVGSYRCTITVGSSGQTASTVVQLDVNMAAKS